MAFTQEQLDALDDAISRGVRKVEYDGESVTYESMSEMLRLKSIMERQLSGNVTTRRVFGTGRGLR